MKPLEDRVGQMLMAGFDGFTAPDYFLEWLREGRLGGVILFARNVENPQQLARLTSELRAAAKYPLLIAIDQEGGTVARMREGFSESPGALALASIAQGSEAITEAVSGVLGREMLACGINWTYAPVVDISYNAANPTVGTRSFGSDVEQVAVLASAAVRGFQSNGVAACAKHFPGLGNTAIDTHLALPRLDTDTEHLLSVDLLPYRIAIREGLATIMTTHTIFNALDPDHPATLSESIVKRLIREELGFDGVVTTDCLEMKAIDDYYGVGDSVVRGANAGIDILLFSHTAEKQAMAYDQLLAAVQRGDVSEETINAANDRIEALKARFPAGDTDPAQVYNDDNQTIVRQAARGAVTLIRSEMDSLPLRPDDARSILFVEFAPSVDSLVQEADTQTNLVQFVKEKLPQIRTVALPPRPTPEQIEKVLATPADVLILATRNAHINPAQREAVQQLGQTNAKLILLALRNPYDAGLIEGGTVIGTLGDSLPSLEAAAQALASEFVPSGRLPVEI